MFLFSELYLLYNYISCIYNYCLGMAMRGFSSFEARFRAKMAKATPTEVLVKKKAKEGLTKQEIEDYKATFDKFDADGGGTIDSQELGKLIRVLG